MDILETVYTLELMLIPDNSLELPQLWGTNKQNMTAANRDALAFTPCLMKYLSALTVVVRLTWSICPQWGAPPLLSLSRPQTWPGLLGRCHCCWTSSSPSERTAGWLCVSPFYTARLRFELNWQTRDFCDLTTLPKYCRSNRKERSKPLTEIGNVLIFPSYTAILVAYLLLVVNSLTGKLQVHVHQ